MKRQIALLVCVIFSVGLAGTSALAQSTSYFLFDGDSNQAWEIQGGMVVNSFSTFSLGYPVAIRDTIWLGDRDDRNAIEYTLGGVATGNTIVGGNNFSQLLDGTAGFGVNYGIECCGSTNSVTVANADWTNQQVLFNLPGNSFGAGIAFDPTTNSLFTSTTNAVITQFDLSGNTLGSFNLGRTLAALAYERATDTLWGFDRSAGDVVQFSKSGMVLNSFFVGSLGNVWAGEMSAIPEPSSALLLVGLGIATVAGRRRRQS